MREKNQFRNALNILEKYFTVSSVDNYLPLQIFLKNHFRENRQMGSTDRKTISSLLYNFFRLGKILSNLPLENRIVIGNFIIEKEKSTLLDYIISHHSNLSPIDLKLDFDEKLKLIKNNYSDFEISDVFLFSNELSDGIDKNIFYQSFFIQPKLWIHLKKDAGAENFLPLLKNENISFEQHLEYPESISLDNRTSLDKWKDKGWFEIQDLSSQLVGNYFLPNDNEQWWDCCTGSGGKSLLLIYKNSSVKIFATDNRESILKNLECRMKNVEFKNISTLQLDLIANCQLPIANSSFDGIIADVPCSGSGTWSRTPEMLSQFSIEEIEHYQQLQMKIVKNIIQYLKNGKPLIYVTCSVFKKENEDVVNFLVNECEMKLEKMELLKGYDKFADTMFVARLLKN